MTGKDRTPRPVSGLRSELLDDELLLYHAERTRVIALNSTASLIWSLCNGGRSLAEVEKLLVDAYPEAASRIPADVEQAVKLLVEEGALELSEASAP